MLFGNSEGDKNHIIEKLSKLLYILSLSYIDNVYEPLQRNINNTLVHRGLLRAPVINIETKKAIQTKRAIPLGRQRHIHKDHIVNISGFYQL